uniref:Macro domain-containing protein n=1 Tax=Chromera velia CCMP2878 TaxID=1169474 RepID=A0A0G4G577_9ALVE|mmetsp:Transcript_43974/g.86804  ORF Transcript_43974/g.86804 Transcript_43974/m.86804 type:complete len:325 (-) Transcript_43974:28-1002(-)|eukprot:Cvel_4176.t1-p1 / transcript=Cvel_4176.t1 / gene=Cvel_4176 / organism=Chromera_velia_CCMP2878 / gene_product=O-acetyl-ADP-ribose deacetylase MACROD2, putative / transcript_product=O-acetyl-ADP-ribose deacetylase MACROD2, putative / location=Cvel_scaffold180:28557-29528(-) / protein_length=324 / sequence_SO=supercontig / SO=protein_coding / is_pseudo=false
MPHFAGTRCSLHVSSFSNAVSFCAAFARPALPSPDGSVQRRYFGGAKHLPRPGIHVVSYFRANRGLQNPGFGRDIQGVRYGREKDALPSRTGAGVLEKDRASGVPERGRRLDGRTVDVLDIPVFDQLNEKGSDHLFKKIALHFGDIIRIRADALVNGAVCGLLPREFAGTDSSKPGALYAEGGPRFMANCEETGTCPEGDVRVHEAAGGLVCKNVIHTVVPQAALPEDADALEGLSGCYRKVLETAQKAGLRSILFPCLGTSVHGVQRYLAARAATDAVAGWLTESASNWQSVDRIVFVTLWTDDWQTYNQLIPLRMNRLASVQ